MGTIIVYELVSCERKLSSLINNNLMILLDEIELVPSNSFMATRAPSSLAICDHNFEFVLSVP